MSDGVRPPRFSAEEFFASEKVGMEVRGGSDVPGVASQAACTETVRVVGEIHDDSFDDLLGEFGGGRRASLGRGTSGMYSPDFGLSSVPNSLGK